MLFEMVTGRLPFLATDPIALLRAHINEPAPTPAEISPDLPKAVDALIARAMHKRPDARFASAEAMAAAVEAASAPQASSGRGWLFWLVMVLFAGLALAAWRLHWVD